MHQGKKVRNTKQRRYMLELLKSTKSHPSAFWLYEKMLPEFPSLSLSTVYRNLGILENQGLLQRLSCGGAFDRYDGDISMHSHFFCRKCGNVYDIEAKELEKNALKCACSEGHNLEICSITYYGMCSECYKKNNKEE